MTGSLSSFKRMAVCAPYQEEKLKVLWVCYTYGLTKLWHNIKMILPSYSILEQPPKAPNSSGSGETLVSGWAAKKSIEKGNKVKPN